MQNILPHIDGVRQIITTIDQLTINKLACSVWSITSHPTWTNTLENLYSLHINHPVVCVLVCDCLYIS